ncbi:MAG: hypothetical protein LH471_02140 [Salinibacterium sp.]|nr:hypothetical protein [Salinibacterium sp.]
MRREQQHGDTATPGVIAITTMALATTVLRMSAVPGCRAAVLRAAVLPCCRAAASN